MKKSPFLFAFLLLIVNGFSQNAEIQFIKTVYNFGEMISGDFPPAAFIFVNSTNKQVAIVSVKGDNEVRISYAHKFIQPGDSGIIYVSFESGRIGSFTKNIEVVLNISEKPYNLLLRGNNLSSVQCFADPKNWSLRKINVIDSVTKEPVAMAEALFLCYTNGKQITTICDKQGKKIVELPIGLYDVVIRAKGYRPYKNTRHIPKTAPVLFFELTPDIHPVSNQKPIAENYQVIKNEQIKEKITEIEPTKKNETLQELPKDRFRSNNIVFLIDISKSMQSQNRFGKLKECLGVLFNAMRDIDNVSILVYNTKSIVLIESESGLHHQIMQEAIDTIKPSGFTNGVNGLENAYIIARRHFTADGNNQVILATDGEFSDGRNSELTMKNIIETNARNEIRLSIVGFAETKTVLDNLQLMGLAGNGHFLLINQNFDNQLLLNEIKSMSAK